MIIKEIVRLNYLPTSQLLKPLVCENQWIAVFLAYHEFTFVETSKNLKNYEFFNFAFLPFSSSGDGCICSHLNASCQHQ